MHLHQPLHTLQAAVLVLEIYVTSLRDVPASEVDKILPIGCYMISGTRLAIENDI
jgi:hypothetical protein